MNVVLWIIQILLALMFLFAGGTKLVMSYSDMLAMGPPNQIVFPEVFIRFIGVCEVLGALGLVLPGLLRIRPILTPLAAIGLTILMIGATVVSAVTDIRTMFFPLIAGLLCAFVAYGRSQLVPHGARVSV